jgi:outer membrane receptor protein involved in Fe transport
MKVNPLKINPLTKAVRAAMFGGAALTTATALPVAHAQDPNAGQLEEITVTGSRIKRSGFETASPVAIVTSESIKISGQTRIEDLLNQLPQIEAAQTSFISNGSSGTANIDLRGLGTKRTLVLVNGRRLQPGGVSSDAPDVNQIPTSLIERTEVLTGGASATYGADAVAGVVNFIMKTDFDGLEVNLGAQAYQHNNDNSYIQSKMDLRNFSYPTGSSGLDGKTYKADVAIGSDFSDGNGHAVAYATFRRNEELREAARDYASCALNNAGTSCGGSANAIIPNFIIGTTDLSDYDYWTLDRAGNGFDINSFNPEPYNYAPINHFMRPDTRYSGGTFINYEVNESFKPFMEASFYNDETRAQIAESGTFFNDYYILPLNTSIISDVQRNQIATRFGLDPNTDSFGVYIGKRNVEGGPRSSNFEHSAFRIVAGAEGDITDDWGYNASFQLGKTSSNLAYINDVNGNKVFTALDPVACAADPSCTLYDVFTLNGVTPQQASYIIGTGIVRGDTKEEIYNAYVTGSIDASLPSASSPLDLVFGVEYREETFIVDADTIFAEGLLLGQGGPTPSVNGSYNVKEFFTEAHVPIVEGNMNLSTDLAYRYSDYNTFGGASTYKIGFEFQPVDMLRVRAGYNRAVRVPNVNELYLPQVNGLWNGTDPCSGATPQFTAAQCANTGVTAAQYGNISASPASQYNGLFGGNPQLQPEVADTYTFGVVVSPMDEMQFSVDYWSIEIDDVINTVGGELIVRQCGTSGNPTFCDRITRSATGSLWLGTQGKVEDVFINTGTNKWEGVDIAGTWDVDLFGGNLGMDLTATYMINKETAPLPVVDQETRDAVYDCVGLLNTDCFATPKWRVIFVATYDMGTSWSTNLRTRTMGKVRYDGTADTIANGNLGQQTYVDLSGAYQITDNLAVLVGVNNILDKEPPMVGGTLTSNGNVASGNYDVLGRQLFLNVELRY